MEHEPYNQDNSSISDTSDTSRRARWTVPFAIALIGAAAFGVGYGLRQQSIVGQMSARQNENSAQMAQMRTQMDTLNARLSEALSSLERQQQQQLPQPQSAQAEASAPPPQPARPVNPARRGNRATGGGKQLHPRRAQLSDQQKQLKDTQDALAQTRSDLETSLSATRDDLNGSIARTHEEVVALAKRGERNYAEFDLMKHSGYERTGPVSLSLRKADTKHQRFDVNLIVDDTQLTKKGVNLYEPIWIHRADDPQPIQIIINKIERDHVHGYVSSPKYRRSELANVDYSSPANPAPANSGTSVNSDGQKAQPATAPPPAAAKPEAGAPPTN
jgi:hypothetical protein